VTTKNPQTVGDARELRLEISQDHVTLGGIVGEFAEFVGGFDPSDEEYGEDKRSARVWNRLVPAIKAAQKFLKTADSTPMEGQDVSMLDEVSKGLALVPSVMEIVEDVSPDDELLLESGNELLKFGACFAEAVNRLK
jgi:hypothetical protein